MPSEKEEKQHAPDTGRTYERGDPADETTDGEMGEVRNTPQDAPDSVKGSVRNDADEMEMTADDITDETDREPIDGKSAKTDVDPAEAAPAATGRSGTGHHDIDDKEPGQ